MVAKEGEMEKEKKKEMKQVIKEIFKWDLESKAVPGRHFYGKELSCMLEIAEEKVLV